MATLYQPVLTTHHSSQWDRLNMDISGGRGRVVAVGAGGGLVSAEAWAQMAKS